MRIAIVNHSRHRVGGAEAYLNSVIPAFASAGHEIACLYEFDARNDRESISMPQSAPQWCVAELGRKTSLAKLWEWQPDVCFTHGLHDVELEAKLVATYRSALYLHNYYGTCISGDKTLSRGMATPCNRRFGPTCLLHYFPDRCGGLNPITMWNSYQLQSKRLELMRRYTALIANSEHIVREAVRHGLQAACVHCPIAPTEHDHTDSVALEAPLQFIFVGRFTPLKGGQHLLTALPEVQRRLDADLQITFAGDGPERKSWERRALEISTDRIRIEFPGWLGAADLKSRLASSHLLVYPSIWPEPFGLSGLEAGLFGVPSVAFAVGGIPEWLHDGVNGHLADLPAGPQTLADAIVRSLSDAGHYAALRNGASHESSRYRLDQHVNDLLKIFARCTA
jgi:glycosyltransferase involved in cell wall biosynthesis